jgi:16S rRNA (cytidine1402-2'-O)-methyltransferase
MTKHFEEVLRGPLEELATTVRDRDIKGEIVVLVDRAPPVEATADRIGTALDQALQSMSVKDAATFVSQTLGVSRRIVYQIALDRSQG